jgi:hypothetical protein
MMEDAVVDGGAERESFSRRVSTVLFMKFDSTVLSRIPVSGANANPPDDQQNAPVKNKDPDGTF